MTRTRIAVAALAAAAVLAVASPATAAPTYEITPHDGAIHEVTDNVARQLGYDEWVALGRPTPTVADVRYTGYSWSPAIYAVTPWANGRWHSLSYAAWTRAGRPAKSPASWVPGSYVYRWSTNSQIGIIDPSGHYHWLTHAQWSAAGQPQPDVRHNQGFAKLSWAPEIAFMTSVSTGAGSPISAATWRAENYPTPHVTRSFPGERFYRQAGSDTIYYAGPTMNRAITRAEWIGAGSPTPQVNGVESPKLYTLAQFMRAGVINWEGKKYTYYSQSVLPGGGLRIPGRHVSADGYVSDGDGYIVLANSAPLGTVVATPFGAPGKVYDRGTSGNHYDVYIR